MNQAREAIISELWRRLYSVTGIKRVARNAETPADPDDHPWVNMVELADNITGRGRRGGRPVYQRDLRLALESFISGTTEEAASSELAAFVGLVKQAIFSDGDSLGGLCSVEELDCSKVVNIAGVGHIKGVGIGFKILYVESI